MLPLPRRNTVRHRVVAVLVLVAAAVAASAEVAEPAYVQFPRGIGFSIGRISGTGLSYRQWITPKVGIQASAGALYLPMQSGATYAYPANLLQYWTGLEVMRSLYATEFTKWLYGQVYLFAGLTHYGFVPWVTTYEADGYTISSIDPGAYVPGFGLGVGVGIEIALFRHFSAAFELGYAAFWQNDAATFMDQLTVELVPQGVIHFRY
jgi:hypothetical protein